MGLNVKGVDASERFFAALDGVADPEQKRKIIGRTFVEVFEEESGKISGAAFLAQGTIYPAVIESVSEVRRVGRALDIPSAILERHPFPGPGLGIRILGDITPEKVSLLQEADYIWTQSLKDNGLYNEVWQAGAILLPVYSVGVMGDERTYERTVALRAVTSTDGMTADWSRLPHEFMAKVSNDIINRVKGVNRVVYDISSKPPATIEWE